MSFIPASEIAFNASLCLSIISHSVYSCDSVWELLPLEKSPRKNTLQYLKTIFNRKISNKQLAEIVGYHEYHLNRLFVRDTGKSLHRYLLAMRIFEAKRLLTNTDMSLLDIAEAVGFSSNTHFADCFKKTVGQSPSDYKASMKSKI